MLPYTETSQLIFRTDHMTGFYMVGTMPISGFIKMLGLQKCSGFSISFPAGFNLKPRKDCMLYDCMFNTFSTGKIEKLDF